MGKYFLISLVCFALVLLPILVLAQAVTTTDSLGISVTIGEPEFEPPEPSYPWGPGLATVIFKGKAYPYAFLTILKNGKVAATFSAEDSGLFEAKLTGLEGGRYVFSVWAEDTKGRRSVTLSFELEILIGTVTTISGIFISPTIEVFPTQVERGGEVSIFGHSFPESDIRIHISPLNEIKETQTSLKGEWLYNLDTEGLADGQYDVKAKAFHGDGDQSQFSQKLSFLVVPKVELVCWGADLNFDGRVDIIDFSILLYFWGQTNPANSCADINFDGIVDIFDFSIMMYWWTG